MTTILRGIARTVSRHARIALALLIFATGAAGGAVLYVGIDGFYLRAIAANPGIQALNGYPSMQLQPVRIPGKSLKGPLAQTLGVSGTTNVGTITGYEFRNAWNKSAPVCLGALTAGADAGQNHDPVQALNCSNQAHNEIWIPAQWEQDGGRFTWLVNYQYPSMCLNTNETLGQGGAAQLWDCYHYTNGSSGLAINEAWDFRDWYTNMKSGINPSPIFLGSSHFCLDTDRFNANPRKNNNLPDGTNVTLWNCLSGAPNQYWY